MKCIFGVDVGGTQIKVGKFIEGELVLKYTIDTDSSNNGEKIFDEICKSIKDALGDDELIGIGIGVPGPVLDDKVLKAHALGWNVLDVKKKINCCFPNALVKVLNDANAAAFGEVLGGAAKGYNNVIMLTIGTGLGGGTIINGRVYEGSNGSSGEIGHICLERNGRSCNCGLHGCLEQYVSARGIVKTAIEMRENKETLLNKRGLTCKEVFEFAKTGDVVASEVVEEFSEQLAIGCADICNVFNPELILLGGGVSEAGNFLLEKVKNKFSDFAFHTMKNTEFKLASLGNDAGIYGNYYAVRCLLDEKNYI